MLGGDDLLHWEKIAMIPYIKTMMRNEPITFLVMILMIVILIFGAWSSWPTPKKSSGLQTGDLVAEIGRAQTISVV